MIVILIIKYNRYFDSNTKFLFQLFGKTPGVTAVLIYISYMFVCPIGANIKTLYNSFCSFNTYHYQSIFKNLLKKSTDIKAVSKLF